MTRVALLTREYPPDVYGGAGVHVEYLARELRSLVDLEVHAWAGHPAWEAIGSAALRALSVDLRMAEAAAGADVVHSHTWYANLGGHLAKLHHGIPHVATTHSLEPHRPWKAEQLGGGYAVSSWAERVSLEAADAVIAVSHGMARDIREVYPAVGRVEVITNGIDAEEYRPDRATDVLERLGVDPARPLVVFVGRITAQKGVAHLVEAAHRFDPAAQVVLCAGAPDTPEIGADLRARIGRLRAVRDGVVWVEAMVPRREVVQLLTHATLFVCPSIYEPLGIVNLEAMACETAVVASAVGGIPEVVVHGETGLLVDYDPERPAEFEAGLAAAVDELVADPPRAAAMGRAGRERVLASFSWPVIARQTADLYETLAA